MIIPFRDENKNKKIPFVTISLILINIAVFIISKVISGNISQFYQMFGSIPYELINFKSAETLLNFNRGFPFFLTFITSLFVHGSAMHLIGNMLYLWIFGKRIEEDLGKILFIVFYILCGLISSYVNALVDYFDLLPMFVAYDKFTPSIGASGVIAGCMGAYLIKYPKSIIDILFVVFVLRIRAYWFLILWIFTQILSVLPIGGITENNTAWYAHIGGFAGGILLILLIELIKKALRKNKDNNPINNNETNETNNNES